MKWLSLLLAFVLTACGGGGGESTVPKVPDVAVFFVSGHAGLLDGQPSYSYLNTTAGPEIVADLRSAGYSVEEGYYVDDAYPVNGYGGYQSLVADMRKVRDKYVVNGTKVIVVAHSHGGVWAHSAIKEVSDLAITALVDLDVSSYGWNSVDHNLQNSFIGGDPRGRYTIGRLNSCPMYPSIASEDTFEYDVEDVISSNVRFAFEVRSSEIAPGLFEHYDEKWNIRENGGTNDLYCYFAATSHKEVHRSNGTTLPVVKAWLRDMLIKQ